MGTAPSQDLTKSCNKVLQKVRATKNVTPKRVASIWAAFGKTDKDGSYYYVGCDSLVFIVFAHCLFKIFVTRIIDRKLVECESSLGQWECV